MKLRFRSWQEIKADLPSMIYPMVAGLFIGLYLSEKFK